MIASNEYPKAASGWRNMGLGVKLSAGFAVLTMLSVVLGLFSLERLARTNSAVVVIRDHYLPSTLEAAGLQLALQNVHRAESQMMMAPATTSVPQSRSRCVARSRR